MSRCKLGRGCTEVGPVGLRSICASKELSVMSSFAKATMELFEGRTCSPVSLLYKKGG